MEKYRANLQLWRHRASLAVEPLPEVLRERRARLLSDESGEERSSRTAHLRRQRDLLIARRAKDLVSGLHPTPQNCLKTLL